MVFGFGGAAFGRPFLLLVDEPEWLGIKIDNGWDGGLGKERLFALLPACRRPEWDFPSAGVGDFGANHLSNSGARAAISPNFLDQMVSPGFGDGLEWNKTGKNVWELLASRESLEEVRDPGQ